MPDETRKIMVTRREPMSQKGLRHWSSHLQRKLHKFVYRCLGSRLMPYAVCKTRLRFAQWIRETFGYGYFYVFSWRKGYYKKRSIKRLRPYCIAVIEIKENSPPNFINLTRISRFRWFEPKENKSMSKE